MGQLSVIPVACCFVVVARRFYLIDKKMINQ